MTVMPNMSIEFGQISDCIARDAKIPFNEVAKKIIELFLPLMAVMAKLN